MPNTKEMLMGLLQHDNSPLFMVFGELGELVDYLIANGVTVQEWISVKDRLPEYGQRVIVYSGGVLSPQVYAMHFWRADFNDWVHITHWMPLPQPPKGE